MAYCLLCSLDAERDADAESAWQSELERRWQQMESGAAAGTPAEEAFAALRKKYP